MRRWFIIGIGCLIWPSSTLAYRPFDSTDPAVADVGEIEIEISPFSTHHDDGGTSWIAPAAKFNYGFAKNWEIVLEGELDNSPLAQHSLVENQLSLKTVLREGSLQDGTGISFATEGALLLPGLRGDNGLGASLAAIAGQRWEWGAIHFNLAASLTRDRHGALFVGTILEGPESWAVRPVAEITYSREFGGREEVGVLAGAIWQVKDGLALDFAVRRARANSRPETEFRLGLSLGFSAY